MKEFKYVITDPMGIHARPAGLLVKAVNGYGCKITIAKDEKTANAKGILGIMSLGVKAGDEVTFTFDGEDETEACAAINKFMQENL